MERKIGYGALVALLKDTLQQVMRFENKLCRYGVAHTFQIVKLGCKAVL